MPPIPILLGITAVSLAGFPIPLTVYQSFQLILALQKCHIFAILRRLYNDTVNFCFSTAVEYANYDTEANVEESGEDIVGEDGFKPEMDVYYKCGDGHNETARHINTVEVNGAKLHKIHLSDGTLTKVPAFTLQLLEHPDLTNIPIDVETYCKEVEAGLKTEDIAALARPQALFPLYQYFLYWHNRLYQMPNH